MKARIATWGLLIGVSINGCLTQLPVTFLSGRVVDAKTGEPLPFATVYLNNSSLGTNADQQGVYRLAAVPLGNQGVVASVVSYQTMRLPLRLTDTRPHVVDLKLEPVEQALVSVTVRSRHDKVYSRQLAAFTWEILGSRPQARYCRIQNPNGLSFLDENGHLHAQATQPLVIDNMALGYRISYNLLYFDLYKGNTPLAAIDLLISV